MDSIAKVIEISATSAAGIEDAVRIGLARAARTLDGMRGAWVSDVKVCTDEAGNVTEWRVRLRVSFVLR